YLYAHSVGSEAIGPGGALTEIGSPLLTSDFTGGVAISPDGRFAYVSLQNGGVLIYAIGADGSLSLSGGPTGSGDGMPALTPDGRFLYAPHYSTHAVERFAVQADGSLADLGPTPSIGAGNPLLARITPDGRFLVLLSDTGSPDELRTFAIGADGSLSAAGGPIPTTGGVNGLMAVSPSGRFLFNPNSNEESITTYAIESSGALTALGAPAPVGFRPQALAVSNDGRFLYAEPQNGEVMQAFSVGADGTLSAIGGPTPIGGESDGETPVVRPGVPVAALSAVAAAPGKKTSFDAGGSSDVSAGIASYSWEFGDGKSRTTTSPQTDHIYAKAGVYEAKVTVVDELGCGSGFVFTGQSAYCNGTRAQAALKVDTPPLIHGLVVTPQSFPARASSAATVSRKRRGGPTIHYKLSEAAKIRFVIKRKPKGRRVGGFKARGRRGKNKRPLPRRLQARLKPGRYVVLATATDAAGGRSKPRRAPFRVTEPR
ncbi:MAG TPA: PKD domain-containing protein, partial [Solirubrobacterales bacterium]|nr:PKD domain-containing protein [Solirubrobacterales bacterium]